MVMKKHKKKRQIKKQPSKKRGKAKKKSNIWILIIVGLISLIILSNFLDKKGADEKKAIIENLTFNEMGNSNNGWLSFYIRNDYGEYADCSVRLFLNNESFSWNIGIMQPNSRKLLKKQIFMPDGITNIKLSADCQWKKEIEILECESSTFKICDLVKEDARLKQCLNRDIPSQYFCIALIKNDVDYCEDIKIIHRKIHCKAFIEKKPELCENLNQWKDWCYQDYGINRRDEEICKKIENKDKRNSCLGVATLNVELCKDINEVDKFICIVNLAEFTKDKKLCELLVDKERCYKDLGAK